MEKQADAKRDLWTMLEEYGRSDYYPMHMPGHKRRGDAAVSYTHLRAHET